VISAVVLAACGHAASAAPKGWQPLPGASAAWANGSGRAAQEYYYRRVRFGGTLQDLASAVTINVLLHQRAARLRGSVPFAPCPGAAGVATFTLPGGQILEEGFSVSNGESVRTAYIRPAAAAADANVTAAMQSALCVAPA